MWYNASWLNRIKISTNSAKVVSNENGFALYFDLSQLPSVGFWDSVLASGADIRVTTSDETTEVPLEIVGFNSTTEVGQLYFKGDIVSTGDDFYIYFNNASATAYGVSDTYGRNNVWTSYKVVIHGESDSTDSSGNITPSETGVTSATGAIGGARQIGTTDADEVTLGNLAWIGGATAVTMSGIFRFNNATRDNTILSKGAFAATEPILIWRDEAAFNSGRTDTISVIFGDGSDKRLEGATNSGLANTNLHIFTSFIANNATGIHLLINGSEDANSPISSVGLTALSTNTSNLSIGGVYTNTGRSMDGWFDEFRLANATFSNGWGQTEHNNLTDQATFWTVGSVESYSAGGSYSNGYSYRRKITYDNTKVIGSADHTNITVPFAGTYAHLKSVSNGGKVESTSGNDIRFETSSGVKIEHDLAYYDPTTGAIEAWLKIPTLYYSVDTEIYSYYGKSGAAAEENKTGAWSDDFDSVYHLNESGNGTTDEFKDSKGANHGTGGSGTSAEVPAQTTGVTGVSNQGQSFTSANYDHINMGDVHDVRLSDKLAICFAKTTAPTTTMAMVAKSLYGSSSGRWYQVGWGGSSELTTMIQFPSGQVKIDWIDSPTLDDNQWRMFTSRVDRSGSLDLVLDGVVKATASISAKSADDVNITADFLIGTYNDVDGIGRHPTYGAYQGEIDEVWILSAIRSDDWLKTVKNAVIGVSTFYTVGAEESPVVSGSHIKAYVSGAFVLKPLKVWNGTAWVDTTLKRYNGVSWDTL